MTLEISKNTGLTGRIAGASSRHSWRTLAIWFGSMVALVVVAGAAGGGFVTETNLTNNPESSRAEDLLEERLRGKKPPTETVVISSATTTVDDPQFELFVGAVVDGLRRETDMVSSAESFYERLEAGDRSADQLISRDRRTTILPVTLTGTREDLADYQAEYVALVESLAEDGFELRTVGSASGSEEYGKTAAAGIQRAEIIGIPIALVVLVVVFGALVAALLPTVLGIVTILTAVSISAIIGGLVDLNFQVTTMITMIGMAVGIDYALFVIHRYREERELGAAKQQAIERAGDTSGKAIVFSGVTVIVALGGLFIVPVSVFRDFGIGAAVAVAVAVVATQSLVPALLGLLGDRIDWPRRRDYSGVTADRTRRAGGWASLSHAIMARPVVSLAVAGGVLLAASSPVVNMKTGQAGVETLPESDVKTAYMVLRDEFAAGLIAPVEIVIDGDATDPEVVAAREALVAKVAEDGRFGPARVQSNSANDLTLVSVPLTVENNTDEAFEAVADLRDSIVPSAFQGAPAEVLVGGDPASTADFNSILETYTPIVFAFVLGLSFLLLMLVFRSVVIPAKAILMNLLSVGAAYGLLVLVFQEGIGNELFGFTQTPTVEGWLPIFLFCILFGLSMDYHVFLLSRIQERYQATRHNAEAVAFGLQATGGIITGAAAIMAAVFAAFATSDLVTIQQMGFGLGVAVLIDATLIRSIIVPATMELLGDWNWYLPRWLRWLPDLRIDSSPAEVALLDQDTPARAA
jgi:RND superfamily putative drug exporter